MILIPEPWARINDKFVSNDKINSTPLNHDVKNSLIEGEPNNFDDRFQCKFYSKFGLDIVTETVFNYPYPYVSEKTMRPIGSKRMFIVLGPHGILELLHKKGFKTFEDIIDESYDSITDPEERFFSVTHSIKKYLTLSIEEIKDYYIKNENKFENNFEILSNLRKTELEYYTKKLGLNYDKQ